MLSVSTSTYKHESPLANSDHCMTFPNKYLTTLEQAPTTGEEAVPLKHGEPMSLLRGTYRNT